MGNDFFLFIYGQVRNAAHEMGLADRKLKTKRQRHKEKLLPMGLFRQTINDYVSVTSRNGQLSLVGKYKIM